MAEHAKRWRPSLWACPDCCDVLTKRKERITAALSRGGYSFRHDSFVIHFSSDFFSRLTVPSDSPPFRVFGGFL
ncbi:hypothetical protein SELSPUOL_01966 [Selenomonas sputigena ATCC 35185]|uniref:Uncharacterized protein n=1 Tax=Selenomonas sputigena (strain ATCC 35185 / DSM 20758 / CCUG 44933 / VPI D19B-28) TaxID=546271 RepID=C9LWW1_SELS3|nr:hypothetical protein SELSPUOL_01966 [Selenomonas sputigena ATCC 35185]